MTRQRLLFVTTDPLTEVMPGPAIRAWHLAAELAPHHDVTLVSSVACTRSHPEMEVRVGDEAAVAELCDWMTVAVGPGSLVTRYPCMRETTKPVVIDIYDPYHLENLAAPGSPLAEVDATVRRLGAVVNDDLRRGDFFLCASERQRDFWIGSLSALGRVNARTYRDDERLERLISVVPFGVPRVPPEAGEATTATGLVAPGRRRWPVVLWAGGVYDWFDPVTLLRAVHALRPELPDIYLVFMGMGHPNPEIPEMRVAAELREVAAELGMGDDVVAFNRTWVPYEARGAALLAADVGVSTSLDHLEARFSFRTRVLDYLWAGLPTVLTRGDVLSRLVADEGIGVAVPPGDPAAVAEGIRRMATAPPSAEAVRAVGARFSWDRVVAPLAEYCRDPWRAPDRAPRPGSGSAPDLGAAPGGQDHPAPSTSPPGRPSLRSRLARRVASPGRGPAA